MARPAASSEAFTMREPEASLETELPAMEELLFRNRRAEFAAVFVATTGILLFLLLEEIPPASCGRCMWRPTWRPSRTRDRLPTHRPACSYAKRMPSRQFLPDVGVFQRLVGKRSDRTSGPKRCKAAKSAAYTRQNLPAGSKTCRLEGKRILKGNQRLNRKLPGSGRNRGTGRRAACGAARSCPMPSDLCPVRRLTAAG